MHPLKKYRVEEGLTQEVFAQRLGYSKGALKSWEYITRFPSRCALEKIETVTNRQVTSANLLDYFRENSPSDKRGAE